METENRLIFKLLADCPATISHIQFPTKHNSWSARYWPISRAPIDPVTRCWIRYFLQLTKLLQCRAQRCMLNRRICNYFPDITTAKRFKVAQLGNVRKCVCSSGARHDIRIADCCNPCSALSSPSSIRGLSATWNWPRNTDRVMLKLAQ